MKAKQGPKRRILTQQSAFSTPTLVSLFAILPNLMAESAPVTSAGQAEFGLVSPPALPAPGTYRVWPSEPPPGCPFPASETIKAVSFTGRHAEYTGADTWYPSWASDGVLYSPWTDGANRRFAFNSRTTLLADEVKPGTANIGLSEIAVFRAKP